MIRDSGGTRRAALQFRTSSSLREYCAWITVFFVNVNFVDASRGWPDSHYLFLSRACAARRKGSKRRRPHLLALRVQGLCPRTICAKRKMGNRRKLAALAGRISACTRIPLRRHGAMLRETPATPQTAPVSDPFLACHKLLRPKRVKVKGRVKNNLNVKIDSTKIT